MVLCMGLHIVLGHDGFQPLVFFRSGQGNYGYVRTCIYVCCNTERNIMKNQAGRPDFGSKGKYLC